MTMTKSRWAAIGAAIAVSFGAGSIGIGQATSPSGASVFVAMTPCRMMDTRPDFQVGSRSAPLAGNDTYTLAGTGTVGQCVIPGGATGLVLNVTAVRASAATFLTIYPAGETRPNASHVNPAPGQPPAPNAVTTNLGVGQQFSIFNNAGTVHVFADVVGYYTDHNHDDRYYTKAEADTAFSTPPVDHLTIPIGNFSPADSRLSGSEGWQFQQAYWRFNEAASPEQACLVAAVGLPEGALVTSIDVSYAQQDPPIPLVATIVSVIGAAGTFANEFDVIKYHYYSDTDLPTTASDGIGRVSLPHDNSVLAGVGTTRSPILDELASPAIQLCVENDVSLVNVRVNFDLP